MPFTRRSVLTAACGALPLLSGIAAADDFPKTLPEDGWREFEVLTTIGVEAPASDTHVWLPLPSVSDSTWIVPKATSFTIDGGEGVVETVGPHRARVFHAVTQSVGAKLEIRLRATVATRDRHVALDRRPAAHAPLPAAERRLCLAPTRLIPTDGIVRDTANRITKGARNDLDKAQHLYQWIVANCFRDAKVPGCGLGNIKVMLETGYLGGKCADLNALFVGLARASGLPACDLYGIRVAPSRRGYASLGPATPTITKSQHCRAEVYLDRFGWVPVDPADVRKVALEEPPGNMPLSDPKVAGAQQMLFGGWEGNWIAYNTAHDLQLPGSRRESLPFLMYPQGESPAGIMNPLDPDGFTYAITARELSV